VISMDDSELKEQLPLVCAGNVLFDEPMTRHTSFRVGGRADILAYPKDRQDLERLLGFLKARGFYYYILGKGTNVLVKDGGIRGAVINLSQGFKDVNLVKENGENVLIRADTGVSLSDLLAYSLREGLSGLEFAAGIPGTVGGALAMNAGTRQGSMNDITNSVTLISPWGKISRLKRIELRFAYRKLELGEGYIILEAVFDLKKAPTEEIRNRVNSNISHKRRTQPLNQPSAGCIFKNPRGYYAGQLIEEAGLKGYRIGDAMISHVHGNFIVNVGEARACDILKLMNLIEHRIKESSGITLEPEIQILGEDA
jgi:UDP-N-acetylmuramate dehydrogenase